MEQLKGMNFATLLRKLQLPDEEFHAWLEDLKLITRNKVCVCGTKMRIDKVKGGKIHKRFRCTKKGCSKKLGYYSGTFFKKAHLSAKEIFELSYFWSLDRTVTYEEIAREMQREGRKTISSKTLVDWMNFFRDVCCEYFLRNPLKVGGPGKVVEVGKTVIARRKYGKGREVDEQWIFGGIERESGICFMVPVGQCSAETLLPIIQKFVLPGTTVVSNLWHGPDDLPAAFNELKKSCAISFGDPKTKPSTTAIELTWQKFKQGHKARHGTHRSSLLSYIHQFVWKKQFGGGNGLYNLWKQIADLYPVKEKVTEFEVEDGKR